MHHLGTGITLTRIYQIVIVDLKYDALLANQAEKESLRLVQQKICSKCACLYSC